MNQQKGDLYLSAFQMNFLNFIELKKDPDLSLYKYSNMWTIEGKEEIKTKTEKSWEPRKGFLNKDQV